MEPLSTIFNILDDGVIFGVIVSGTKKSTWPEKNIYLNDFLKVKTYS
jgi:hypothetical protein